MNKLFVPYELSLKLKELDFYEECLGSYYTNHEENITDQYDVRGKLTASFDFNPFTDEDDTGYVVNSEKDYYVTAPLWCQVWEWFEDEHQLFSEQSNMLLDYAISTTKDGVKIIKPLETDSKYKNRDEVKEARLKHLIKIVKEWKQTK